MVAAQNIRSLGTWAIAVAAVLALAGAAPPSASDDLAAITRGEDAFGGAFVTGDAATLDRLLDDDFMGVQASGTLYDKKQALQWVSEGPNNTFDRVDDLKVRFYGDTAIAQGHESERGPAPELKPLRRVFTDTWVKRQGTWRIAAASDIDPGTATPPAFAADGEAIRALRARSNAAIRAHDMAAFLPVFADDAVFVWSNGTSSVGKAGLQASFARDFADPAFMTYIRTPQRVSVSENGQRAAELGTWTALKRDTRYGGDYIAHWFKGAGGWQVRGEIYVKLYCQGPLCTP